MSDTDSKAVDHDPPANADEKSAASEPVPTMPEPAGVPVLRTIDKTLGLGEQCLLVVLLVVLIGMGTIQAIATLAGKGLPWSEEVIRYSVFFIAMAGAALSAHTEQLIAMDFVTRLLSPGRRATLRLVLRLFTFAMCMLLVIGGAGLSRETGSETYHVVPPEIGLLAIPVGATLIAVHVALHFGVDILYLLSGRTPPERNQMTAH